MKRYPKRARPLWGVAKRRPWPPSGVSLTFGPGTYVEGDVYTFTSTQRGAAPITFGYAVGPTPPRPGVLTFTTAGTTPIRESGPRVSADGRTAGSIGARAGANFAKGIAAGVVLSHGTPLAAPIALAVEQAREREEADARRRVLESQLGLAAGTLQNEADMRRALAGGAFPAPLTQGDPRP